jgi:hypothetical protein
MRDRGVHRDGEAHAGVRRVPPRVRMAELMPMSSPSPFTSGATGVARVDGGVGLDDVLEREAPPRLGSAMGICRFSALITPEVTVPSSPNGLPMATASSPTRSREESPTVHGGPAVPLDLDDGEVVSGRCRPPRRGAQPVGELHLDRRAPATTWLLVRMCPSDAVHDARAVASGPVTKPPPPMSTRTTAGRTASATAATRSAASRPCRAARRAAPRGAPRHRPSGHGPCGRFGRVRAPASAGPGGSGGTPKEPVEAGEVEGRPTLPARPTGRSRRRSRVLLSVPCALRRRCRCSP